MVRQKAKIKGIELDKKLFLSASDQSDFKINNEEGQ